MLNVMKHPFFFFRQLENIVGFYRFAPDIQCFIKNRLSFIDLDSCTPLKSRQLQEKHHKALWQFIKYMYHVKILIFNFLAFR